MPVPGIVKKISDKWFDVIGDSENFSLEKRIFHSISIGLVLLATIYAPYNFWAGLYVAGISAVLLAVFFLLQYYNSRFKGRAHSNVVLGLTGILVFSVNYFTNSGIHGSTDLIWPVYLLLVLAISPYRQHLLWVLLYIAAFFVLHLVEYNHPEFVKHPFLPGRGEFIDRVTAFPMPVIGMAIVIIFIRRSYDREKAAAEEKNATIAAQKEELEQSNAEKSKLLSIVSHDMRAPFINIQGYLQLLNEHNLDDRERQMAEEELLNATDQTLDMLSNLLYWSRAQMKGGGVDIVSANLHAVLVSTIEIEQMLAGKKNISLTHNIDARITVAADVNMLQLVVRNLLSNAIKFTREGGQIKIDARQQKDECLITIADNGVGIPADKQDALFSMKSGATFGTNNEKGVGLGLPLCKEFMERQGGRVEVESIPGEGSCFYVYVRLG